MLSHEFVLITFLLPNSVWRLLLVLVFLIIIIWPNDQIIARHNQKLEASKVTFYLHSHLLWDKRPNIGGWSQMTFLSVLFIIISESIFNLTSSIDVGKQIVTSLSLGNALVMDLYSPTHLTMGDPFIYIQSWLLI